ncbi:Putative glucose-methanol-choline oxidoreductase, FAD/NAD(P)-binding domain superfamily [Septoria linicola]|uniref:Glucose-methanol-choline oxidoreductase, FAD/NAD(P)-binding domain superfamily n=1 Tax=Septoria linicola TaxID=215465 RepID=A0A9Q9B860_9PEZI|nr:putative glucose-methanol-choline oxidoreductase, FAD/NAD(P)-binding domain superfamily [Septoria linicola]USW58151.1 Putative glucose-methanol-choline oxidoreductase, FAD/NAD(P)-binding domain superfamily [Septoria linicola]
MADYDYIVCGGGTSGCVVAARLAEDPHVRVLVIEAGGHNKDLDNVHMVGGCGQIYGTKHDWKLVSVPQKHANDRVLELHRGKFLGGSSGVNGALCIRGAKQAFDNWNLPGWSGEEVFAAMRKSENFHGKEWFEHAPGAHGDRGPLHIEPHDFAPISHLILESMQAKGLPLDHDMFSTGENPHGCGHVPRTHYEGRRTTAADFVTNARNRSNIHLMLNTTVDRINFIRDLAGLRAVSVDVLDAGTQRKTLRADREIIISGGAYCTPPILMRSGIGPREELEGHGIDCVVDSAGVGQNLQDHLIVFSSYEVSEPGLTDDAKIYHEGGLARSYAQYKQDKTGFLAYFPFGAFAYARLDARLQDSELWQEKQAQAAPGRDPMALTDKQPHVEYWNTECYAAPGQYATHVPADGEHAFAIVTELFSPRSTGTVKIKSKDPSENPIIDCNYLANPLDVLVLAEGARLGNEIIMNSEATRKVVKGSWPASSAHHKYTTREEWIPFVKQNATTCYHAAGSAKMGAIDDKYAVLDEQLRVRGVQGLRVADCSVMPNLHGGHTQMVAYAVGERAAVFIKDTWSQANERIVRIDSVQDVKT